MLFFLSPHWLFISSILAIKYDPTNVRYVWERSNLHMRLGEQKQCMDGYRRILSLLPMEEGEHFMQLSKDMAKYRTHMNTHQQQPQST